MHQIAPIEQQFCKQLYGWIILAGPWLAVSAPGSAIEERRVMTRMEYGVVVAVLLVLIATVFVSQYVV